MILPLQIMRFEVKVINKNVQLIWSVSSNEDAKSFEIERADEGNDYKKVGSKLSLGRHGIASYEFVDALPKRNISLSYRIKIVGKDGSWVVSDLQQVKIEELAFKCRLKQNPVRNALEIEILSPEAGELKASVYNNYGQKIATESVKVAAGSNQLMLTPQNLQAGIHRLVMEMGNERKVISFVKE